MFDQFGKLNERRMALGMSYAVLAKRSGVSVATVVRILSGKDPGASWGSLNAIARALGMKINVASSEKPDDLLEKQARQQAERLVKMVQGNSGLESQAVDDDVAESMVKQLVHKLLAGSPRKLWGE
jgi:transcriptional regulator with XRE-family HTH domain